MVVSMRPPHRQAEFIAIAGVMNPDYRDAVPVNDDELLVFFEPTAGEFVAAEATRRVRRRA
jgi:uncharacterized protein YcsI (UPF0317 family)